MTWLATAERYDLSATRGNGPFPRGAFLGVILHVNDARDSNKRPTNTSPGFYASPAPANPNLVCPNVQIDIDGTIHQLLPLDWQPWCQAAGNYNYAAIETGGVDEDELTAAQLQSVAFVVRAYHQQMGMPLQLANKPGQRGLGTHAMGGAAWGGHPCPGKKRTAQRALILSLAEGQSSAGDGEAIDVVSKEDIAAIVAAVWSKRIDVTPPGGTKVSYQLQTYLGRSYANALAAWQRAQANGAAIGKLASAFADGLTALAGRVDTNTAAIAQVRADLAELKEAGSVSVTPTDVPAVLHIGGQP